MIVSVNAYNLLIMILPYEVDPFGGAILAPVQYQSDITIFKKRLSLTLQELTGNGNPLAWLFLTPELSAYIPIAVECGFIFHHADTTGLQLVLQIQDHAFIPAYATHYIGAGGVVVDKNGQILVIQERYHTKKHYKLPGGALEPHEHISEGVVREVFEETGIQTEFEALTCFRHWHGYRYGKSDIYFVCRLKPVTFSIQADPREISEAVWMPVAEYLSHPSTHPFNRKIVETAITTKGLRREEIEGYGTLETHEMLF